MEIYIDGKMYTSGTTKKRISKKGWKTLYIGSYKNNIHEDDAYRKQFAIWNTPLT